MGIKRYKPTTPSLRHRVSFDYAEITKTDPEKSLIAGTLRGRGNGRNNQGRITVRHRGGGNKQFYRVIDFRRKKWDVEAKVAAIEYDPNRTARLALLHYVDGVKAYILAPQGLKLGDRVCAGQHVDVRPGNAMPLRNVPVGAVLHSVEMKPGKGAQLARAAGSYVKLDGKEGKYGMLRMPSGEVRMILLDCMATVGTVASAERVNVKLGNAGRKRQLGHRPSVRGVAMNSHDHPHGGGRGKQKGYKCPVSPSGVPAKGHRTRSPKKASSKFIISQRKR